MVKPELFGGTFTIPLESFKTKVNSVKAIIADWDGVFNNGVKSATAPSGFSEPDSLGLNMLRFSYWLETQNLLPIAIITGEPNESAKMLATREKFNAIYYGVKEKQNAIEHFCSKNKIHPSETTVFFDDIVDLPMVKLAGLRFMINRPGPRAFNDYIITNHLADYITLNYGGQNALREVAELMLTSKGAFERVIDERVLFSTAYQNYLKARDEVKLEILKQDKEGKGFSKA